jgi:outer membrane protein assembly factor BamB
MLKPGFLSLAVLVLALGLSSRADEWPQFRGPTGQGLVPSGSLPTTWSTTRNVVWKQPILGRGWSSPIVCHGRIYLTTAVPVEGSPNNDQSLRALCLDAATGNVLWDKEVIHQDGRTAPGIHGKNSHASPTPVTDGQRLYVHFGHEGTACLDLNGQILWRNRTLTYEPVHGNGGSPILVDDRLVYSADGGDKRFLVALSCKTGEVIWKTDREVEADRKFSFSTPLAIAVQGKKQIISPGTNVVNAFDAATGKEIWRVQYDGYSVIPRPVYGHGLVFVCTGYGTPSLLAIRPDGTGDVTDTHVVWQTNRQVPHTASPVLVENALYFMSDNGIARCLDAKTGKQHWQQRLGVSNSASSIAGDGKIYFLTEQGVGIVLKASTTYELLARNPIEEQTLASYAAADGALYLRTETQLYRIQQR